MAIIGALRQICERTSFRSSTTLSSPWVMQFHAQIVEIANVSRRKHMRTRHGRGGDKRVQRSEDATKRRCVSAQPARRFGDRFVDADDPASITGLYRL